MMAADGGGKLVEVVVHMPLRYALAIDRFLKLGMSPDTVLRGEGCYVPVWALPHSEISMYEFTYEDVIFDALMWWMVRKSRSLERRRVCRARQLACRSEWWNPVDDHLRASEM